MRGPCRRFRVFRSRRGRRDRRPRAPVLLLGRMVTLAGRATGFPPTGGWLCLGFLTVLMLDGPARDSFTGFPTAYMGFLLVGIALAAAREEALERPAAAAR